MPVSYTHLDVYKRQVDGTLITGYVDSRLINSCHKNLPAAAQAVPGGGRRFRRAAGRSAAERGMRPLRSSYAHPQRFVRASGA